MTNDASRANEKLKQARQLCDDLYYLIQQDKDIAEELIDEYVYLLDDNRVQELQKLVDDELGEDEWMKFTSKQYKFTLMFIQGVTLVLISHIVINGGM